MADKANLQDAGRKLAQDLRGLRESRGIPIEALLETTRLPRDIVELFEENALVDHPGFNRVYLRSIAASYAVVIGIQKREALVALDDALDGQYNGALRRKYIDEYDDETVELESSTDVEPAIGFMDSDSHSEAVSEQVEEEAEIAAPGDDEDVSEQIEEQEEAEIAAPSVDESVSPPSEEELSDSDYSEPDTVSETEGDESFRRVIPRSRSRISRTPKPTVLLPRKFGRIIIIASVILAVVVVWSIWLFSGSNEPEVVLPAPVPVDTVEVVQEPDWIVLGDSMHFEVIAVEGVLNPIRVTRDRIPRSPYYIERGDTAHFYAADHITFERRFIIDRADILLEGYSLSDSLIGIDDRMVLTRQRAQNWLDSLAVQLARR